MTITNFGRFNQTHEGFSQSWLLKREKNLSKKARVPPTMSHPMAGEAATAAAEVALW